MDIETIKEIGKVIQHITIDSNSAVEITDKIMKFIWFKQIIIPSLLISVLLGIGVFFGYKIYKQYCKEVNEKKDD